METKNERGDKEKIQGKKQKVPENNAFNNARHHQLATVVFQLWTGTANKFYSSIFRATFYGNLNVLVLTTSGV